jgi:PAS domain S-box-containing protein
MKNNLTGMICLDIYFSSLDEDKYTEAKSLLEPSTKQKINLLSWRIQDLFTGNSVLEDVKSIQALGNNFNWNNEVTTILNKNTYESLIITNTDKKIIWVSDGFKKMTGYTKEFAINKTPSFFQGTITSEATKKRIRKKILENKPFKEVILNYRKDKSTYKCKLKVFPLCSEAKPTYFLALERKVV